MSEYSYSINTIDSDLHLKISSNTLEFNLLVPKPEINYLIQNINKTNWVTRNSIKAGTCLNSSIFWCLNEDGSISLLIGHDDETWEIGLKLPFELIDKIREKIK